MEQKKIPFSTAPPISSEVAYTGTPMQTYLEKNEREARRTMNAWFRIILYHILVISGAIMLIILLTNSHELKLTLGGFGFILIFPLRFAINRYDQACNDLKDCKKKIMAYLQREAGGGMKLSAEVGLKHYFESSNRPTQKGNVIIELLKSKGK